MLGRMQNRYGPNRAGPYGLLQPIADLVKLIRKESFFPAASVDAPYIVAPIVSMFAALAAFSVIPFGAGWQIWHYHVNGEVANVSIALILIFALVAGYHTEYGGMRWGLFQTAEYVNLITLSALAVTLFFGGWHGPYAPLGPLWFFIKLFLFMAFFVWIRASVPRLRYDQLMAFGWKILLPVATVNALVTALLVVWVD